MKKYDNYKDSGIDWIGEIPEHWESIKLKYVLSIQSGKGITNEQFVENGEFEIYGGNGILGMTDSYTNDGLDIIIGRVGALCGNVRLVDGKKWISDNALLAKTTQNHYFIEKCLKVLDLNRLANKNAQPLITGTMVKDQYICLPSIEEQTQIANYLDHKTNQIDTLISKKKQFITLLQEERIAVINQAVTKGLDPNVPMKDSGIEWLGEIPEHWEIKRMKYLCDVTTGGKDTENREDDGEYPFFVRSQTIERISTFSFEGEAILTAGDGVGVCKVWHYVDEKFDFHQRVYMMSNFQTVLGKYLFYYLKENFGKEVMKLSAKSTVDSLRRPMFQNFMVCFGSSEEQKKIIIQIEKEELRIDTLISKSQQEIELLKEYKTALISEVVTGKVDVREEVLN